MNNKAEILSMLRDEFDRWEEVLNGLSPQQITAPNFLSEWSIRDTLAHLMAWQTRSIARLEGALLGKDPEFPKWPTQWDPDLVDDPEQINAWIYTTYRLESWEGVHRAWRAGFQRFLELAEKIPEPDLLDPKRFTWMEGQPLALVLLSSYEHHHIDHLEPLLALLHQK